MNKIVHRFGKRQFFYQTLPEFEKEEGLTFFKVLNFYVG